MNPLILFPDVEMWATNYLRQQLQGRGYLDVHVSNRYVGRDVEVWVRRDGGPVLDVVREGARLSVNVFAKGHNDEAVTELAALVSALLRASANEGPVLRVEQLSGPSPVADKQPRRLMLFELTVRGEEL